MKRSATTGEFVMKKGKAPASPLKGAVKVAVKAAERFGTDMVYKANGKIQRVSPDRYKG